MKRTLGTLMAIALLVGPAFSQPTAGLVLCATQDIGGRGVLQVPDQAGNPATAGWIWQLVRDANGNGPGAPSLVDSTFGLPEAGERLIAEGRLGESPYLPWGTPSVATPLTCPTVWVGQPVYLRVFGADSLAAGVPYIETQEELCPDLPGGFNVPLPLNLFAAGHGGLMQCRLEMGGRPLERAFAGGMADSLQATLELPGRVRIVCSVEDGGLGMQALLLERFDAEPPGWQSDIPSLDGFVVLSSDQVSDPGAGFSAPLELLFTTAEVADRYGAGVEPTDLRLFHETGAGWVEEPGEPVQVQLEWKVRTTLDSTPLAGRWALAPSGANAADEFTSDRPLAFRLHPVYPSPFNPDARIRLDLPERETVRLEVFDILGRRVAVLQDGVLPGGSHTFTFSGGQRASGTYFVRVIAGPHRAVQKMVLIR